MKLFDYNAIRHHGHTVEEKTDAMYPSKPNLWFIHLCDAITAPSTLYIIPMFMLFTCAMCLTLVTAWCLLCMIFGTAAFNWWMLLANVLALGVTKLTHKAGKIMYSRQKLTFGYQWYLIGYTAYLTKRNVMTIDEVSGVFCDAEVLDDYTNDEYDNAQVMFDVGVCEAAKFCKPKSAEDIVTILIQNDERYMAYQYEILTRLKIALNIVDNTFIIDHEKLNILLDASYNDFVKELKAGKNTPVHDSINMSTNKELITK